MGGGGHFLWARKFTGWALDRFNILGGQSSLLGWQIPTQLTSGRSAQK